MEIIDGIKWDFGPNDNIDYFDPEKSYYLTKYRPINGVSGLDFNPDWFREDAINKIKDGKYSKTIYGTPSYKIFWDERFKRCTEGFETHGYRITGDNYFWLNFFRLKESIEGKKASSGRTVSFPMFLTFQYEYFHYIEMCELLDKDAGLLKSRGIGFSEMGAELAVRPFITTPNYRVLASAPSEKHLKPLLSKIWPQLDWCNKETEGAFKRVRMVINTNTHKRASKKSRDGSESGHMSEIEGVVADSPEKIRGDRTERLLYEEAGSDSCLKKKYIQGEALITVLGGNRIGTRIVWGTGGDSGPQVQGLKDIILKPDAYNILKYHHNYTPDGRYVDTGMFIPATRIVSSLLDKRGWCNPVEAKRYEEIKRSKKAEDPKALLIYKAEYCFTIEEAFSQQGDNIFPREELSEQSAQITIYKNTPIPKSGCLTWSKDEDGKQVGVNWRDDNTGKIMIVEHPLKSPEGVGYNNLYVAGIDSIDIGTLDSTGTDKKPSCFCIVIKKRTIGLASPQYVAIYKDRPKDPREAYENAAKLLTYYNCKAVLESTRTALLVYFRDKNYMSLLMKRPRSSMSDITKGKSNMYGAPASIKVIEHYRELIYDFCLEFSDTIYFLDMVEQLLEYSDENKKEFDIVAAMGMCELGDEELSTKKPEIKELKTKEINDIGYWIDRNGYKHSGIIPKTIEGYDKTRIRAEDTWLYSGKV